MAYRSPAYREKAPTTIGSLVAGSLAYRRHPTGIPEFPQYTKVADQAAWAMGWNREAEKAGDPARLDVPTVKQPSKRRRSSASDLEASVIKEAVLIARQRGWNLKRRNTGAVFTPDGRMIRYGGKGAADVFLVVQVNGMPLHIEAEAKRRDGKGRLSAAQLAFAGWCHDEGIPYFTFTSGKEFESKVEKILLDYSSKVG